MIKLQNHLIRSAGIFLLILLAYHSFAQNFYCGNDLSYVNQMEDAGAVYKENMQSKDVYRIFADHGTNLVRVRLWVDPSWWQIPLQQPPGVKPYYSDIEDVKKTIRRSKEAGMQVMLDLHYSDFWADPGRQLIPRTWIGVAGNNEVLRDSVYNYTKRILTSLNAEGLMPEIVKVGNETNGGILKHIPEDGNSFEIKSTVSNSWSRHAVLFNAAIKAIREVGASATINPKIALHFTNKLSGQVGNYQNVINNGITDFDIMGISYYYAWHDGSIKELQSTITSLKSTFSNYQPMVVETGYLWTTENYDELGNIINVPDPAYLPVCPEKQLEYMIDYTRAVKKGGGIGVVFWEPAWVSTACSTPWGVGSSHDHVAFFDPVNTNFMNKGGGRWSEPHFYTDITTKKVIFQADMTGKDVSKGVYITGDFTAENGNWKIMPMLNEGKGIYSYYTFLNTGTTGAYYFLNDSKWEAREKVPAACANAFGTDRQYVISEFDITYLNGFGACGIPDKEPVQVTFKVDMTGQDQSRGVYVTGEINAWKIEKMNPEGNNIYSYTTGLMPYDTLAYYYLTTSTWTDYLNYRETVPPECALEWGSDRQIIVPGFDTIVGVKWASCESIVTSNHLLNQNRSIQIYPNPARGKLNIISDVDLQNSWLSISNIHGQVIRKEELRFVGLNQNIDVSDLLPGLYFFRIQSSTSLDIIKVILY
jgi:arabinogalactan endo-1,4-beta-galactosidase